MSTLTEVAEYIEHVLMLDLETPIKGYDGTDIGPSNEQAQVLANRTKFLKERGDKLEKSLLALQNQPFVISVNKNSGEVTITPESIKAAEAVHKHDPSDITTGDAAQFVNSTEKATWNNKQDKLDGTNLKTINGESLLGKGDIEIDPGKINTSDDAQFVTGTEKKIWNSKQDKLENTVNIKSVNGKNILGKGDLTLTYLDVGADVAGASITAVTDHLAKKDPHQQYLTKDAAATTYVDVSTANKPNGYLQLDEYAKIPSSIADLFSAVYIVVGDMNERLKLEQRSDIIICLQTDNNTVYYLNANLDPAVDDNWDVGQSTAITTIVSVFGRSGVITAQKGDYTADQITETDELTFVTKEDRKNWDDKQDALTSSETIKTINSKSVLGSGDLAITPDNIGAAAVVHTHVPSDIDTDDNHQFVSLAEKTTWSNKQDKLVTKVDVKTLNGKDLVGKGNVDLTPGDIGAAEATHTHKAADIVPDDNHLFVTSTEKTTWNAKQSALKSGTTIKTINKTSLLDSGDLAITPETIGAANVIHTHKAADIETDDTHLFVTQTNIDLWTKKQDKLIDNKNIKTIFGTSVLGTTDLRVSDDDTFASTVFNTLKPGDGTKITYDDSTHVVEISNTGTDAPYKVVEYTGLLAKQGVRIADSDLAKTAGGDGDVIAKIIGRAYYRRNIYASANATIDYKNPVGVIRKTDEASLNYDGLGYPNGNAAAVTYSAVNAGTAVEKYISNPYAYSDFATGTGLLSVALKDKLENALPTFPDTQTSNNTTVEGITSISSTTRNDGVKYFAGNAFKAPLSSTDISNVTIGNYWSSNAYFVNATSEVFLGFTSTTPITISGYGLQSFTKFDWGDVTSPTSWKLQGRDSDNVNWVTIDAQVGQVLKGHTGEFIKYTLAKPAQYKQYRILVTGVINYSAYTAIPRLQFYTPTGVLIKDKNNKYLNLDTAGTINEVAITDKVSFNTYKFGANPNLVDIESIKDRFPIRFCSMSAASTEIKPYKRVNKIFMQDPLNNASFWYGLSTLKATTFSDDTAEAEIRMALTLDGTNYMVYSGGAWVSIGALTNDTTSATTLLSKGMTLAQLGTVTKAQWTSLLSFVDNPRLGIAFARATINTTRLPMPLTLAATADTVSGWEIKSLSDVKVAFDNEYITFTADEAGDYKFCYRLK